MIAKLLKWLLFSVVLSVLPIAANAVLLLANGRGLDLENLLGKGELLLVASGLCAAALGEIIEIRNRYAKILSAGFCTIMLVMSAWLFAAFTEARLSNPQVNVAIVVNFSLLTFFGSVITSSIGAALSE